MAGRYAKAVNELIASLNNPDHRDESAKLLRALIDKIVRNRVLEAALRGVALTG